MHEAALPAEQRSALSSLKPAAERGFYLAGGTGLCLRLGHRRSLDIALFREATFDPEELLRELMAEGLIVANVRTKLNTLWSECSRARCNSRASAEIAKAPSDATPGPRGNGHVPLGYADMNRARAILHDGQRQEI